MTVQLSDNGTIELSGVCSNEEAEVLLQRLLAAPGAAVDWHACQSAHSAVLQVLLLARPQMLGTPQAPGLRDWVQPLLRLRGR